MSNLSNNEGNANLHRSEIPFYSFQKLRKLKNPGSTNRMQSNRDSHAVGMRVHQMSTGKNMALSSRVGKPHTEEPSNFPL